MSGKKSEHISTAEAAEIIGCARTYVAAMLGRGGLKGERIPGAGRGGFCWRVDRESAEAYAKSRRLRREAAAQPEGGAP